MSNEKKRAKEVQSFAKLFVSDKYDSIRQLLNSSLVNKFVNGLLRFSEIKPPEYEKMRGYLDDAIRSGEKIKGTRLGRARLVEKEFKKNLGGFLKKLRTWRAEIVKEERKYEKEGKNKGQAEVDIVFSFTNFNNELPKSAKLKLTFKASKVTLQAALTRGSCRFRGIMLESKKSIVNAEVSLPRKIKPKLSNNMYYNPLKNGDVLAISAAEDPIKIVKSATSAEAAAKSAGTKGTLGVDWKIFSGSAEITKGKSFTETHTKAISFTILAPKGSVTLMQK
ncbi:MAG: hypothetical protein ACE5FS_02565 [Paracoccaceae bacterium]